MKRTIQALIVTSVMLAGCSGTIGTDSAPDNEPTSSFTSEYLTETSQNLHGICRAITEYGLPADDQTHRYVRREVGQIGLIADDQPDLRTTASKTASEVLRDLAAAYTRCDPDMGREIRESASTDPDAG